MEITEPLTALGKRKLCQAQLGTAGTEPLHQAALWAGHRDMGEPLTTQSVEQRGCDQQQLLAPILPTPPCAAGPSGANPVLSSAEEPGGARGVGTQHKPHSSTRSQAERLGHPQTVAVPLQERLFTLQSSQEGSIRCLVL